MCRCVAKWGTGERQPCENTPRRPTTARGAALFQLHSPLLAQSLRPKGAHNCLWAPGRCWQLWFRNLFRAEEVQESYKASNKATPEQDDCAPIPLYAALPQSRTAVLMCPVDPWWPKTKISRPYVVFSFSTSQTNRPCRYSTGTATAAAILTLASMAHGWKSRSIAVVGFARCSSLHTHSNFLV